MEILTNEEMLNLIRKERSNQVINEVISFKKNDYGFYDVLVDMETNFFEVFIKHVKMTLPYPLEDYLKLSKEEELKYRVKI